MTHDWKRNSHKKIETKIAMRPVIEFSECLFDSPKFRSQLSKNEANLDEFEGKLEKLLKLSNTLYESGRQFISVQSQFSAGLWELSSYFAAENPSDASQVSSMSLSSTQYTFRNSTSIPLSTLWTKNIVISLKNINESFDELYFAILENNSWKCKFFHPPSFWPNFFAI